MIKTFVLLPTLGAMIFWGLGPIPSKLGLASGGDSLEAAMTLVTIGVVFMWSTVFVVGTTPFSGLTLGGISLFLLGGFLGTTVGRIANYTGMDRVGASINAAGVSANPMFVFILGVGLLGEHINLQGILGIFILVGGLVVLGYSKGGDVQGWERKDLAFPLLAAVSYGSGHVLRKFALTVSSASIFQAAALNETAAFAGILGYILVRYRGRIFTSSPRTYGYFAVGGVLNSLGLLSLFAALSVGRVVYVTPLVGVSTLLTTLFSYLLLKDIEVVTRGVLAGATAVVVGAALVAMA